MIQERILAIVTNYMERRQRRERVALIRNTLDWELTQLGHALIKEKDNVRCGRCGQFWNRKRNRDMVAMGECPGPALLGQDQPSARPQVVTRGVEIMWHNQVLHKSHHLGWHRGVVFCWLCAPMATIG